MNIDVTYDKESGKNIFTENTEGKHCKISLKIFLGLKIAFLTFPHIP